jgi:hypothetical protein
VTSVTIKGTGIALSVQRLGYRVDDLGPIPGWGKDFSVQTGSEAHTVSDPMGAGGKHLHLVPRLRMHGSILHSSIFLNSVVIN